MHRPVALLLLITACGSTAPVARQPEPVAESDQDVCQKVAERVVDRFVVAATTTQWTESYPDMPAPAADAMLGQHRAMFVTVVFDSCFAEWPSPARACFLDATADAPIDHCKTTLGDTRLATAVRRTRTLLHALAE